MARPTPVLPDVGSTIVPPGLQPAVRLRRLDHGEGRPVLHAAARVEVLELGQEMAGQVPTDAVHAHQRGVADQIDERVGGLHGPAPIADRADAHAGLDAHVVIGVQGHRQAGMVELDGHPRRQLGRADDADGLGDAGPQGGDDIEGDVGAPDGHLVAGTGGQAGRCGPAAHRHEDIHGWERTATPASAGRPGGRAQAGVVRAVCRTVAWRLIRRFLARMRSCFQRTVGLAPRPMPREASGWRPWPPPGLRRPGP